MDLATNKTVRELALEIPGATRVFETMGIDYCCGGQKSLADACAAVGVELEQVKTSLEATTSAGVSEARDFQAAPLTELMDHIVEKHHVFTKSEIERLRALINKVHGVHGQNHPELERIRSLFQSLSAELEPHMMKEERVLFPYIAGVEEAVRTQRPVAPPPFGTVANPVRMMMMEHETAGEVLKEMRAISGNYTPPADGCFSYQTLYAALDAFEKDLHQHIHLENNILFPRAVEMEGATS